MSALPAEPWHDKLARHADAEPATAECDTCDGQGHLDTRHFGRHVADEWTSEICNRCGGTGEVRA